MTAGQPFNPWDAFKDLESCIIPLPLLKYRGIGSSAKLLYARLLRFAGKDGLCRPSEKLLAAEMGIAQRNIRVGLAHLIQKGFIAQRRRGWTRTNLYTFLWHPVFSEGRETAPHERTEPSAHERTEPSAHERTEPSAHERTEPSAHERTKSSAKRVVERVAERARGLSAGKVPSKGIPTTNDQLTDTDLSQRRQSFQDLFNYLKTFTRRIGVEPQLREVQAVQDHLAGASLEQFKTRVEQRLESGLRINSYGVFTKLAEDCARSREAWEAAPERRPVGRVTQWDEARERFLRKHGAADTQ